MSRASVAGTRPRQVRKKFRGISANDQLSFLRSAAMVARPFRSRKPNSSPLWKCFHAHFDHFTAVYPRDYQSRYGMLRGVIPEVVDKFMQCGDFAKGFAHVRCDECSHEYLLAFSCKGGLVLPVMPSEECASVRRDACGVDPRGHAASAFHIHHSKDAAAVLSISPRTAQATLPHRASVRE